MDWRGWDRAEPGLSKEAPGPEGHPGGAGEEWSTPCPLLASQECGPAKPGPRKEGRRQAVPRPLSCPDSYTSAQNQALLDSLKIVQHLKWKHLKIIKFVMFEFGNW